MSRQRQDVDRIAEQFRPAERRAAPKTGGSSFIPKTVNKSPVSQDAGEPLPEGGPHYQTRMPARFFWNRQPTTPAANMRIRLRWRM
jgi:hypothetical protein